VARPSMMEPRGRIAPSARRRAGRVALAALASDDQAPFLHAGDDHHALSAARHLVRDLRSELADELGGLVQAPFYLGLLVLDFRSALRLARRRTSPHRERDREETRSVDGATGVVAMCVHAGPGKHSGCRARQR
jgi:hypothetical protein